jgi:hypothetical protein
LASAARHVGLAISACPITAVRNQLIEHFEDELEHCNGLRDLLRVNLGIQNPERLRPLPTTTAFVGYLEILGRTDWKAYLLASVFLQSSLSGTRAEGRNTKFYEAVTRSSSPEAANVLRSIWQHDELDGELGHDDEAMKRVRSLLKRYTLPRDSVEQAAVLPPLAWSFLDGIQQHYGNGPAALVQRVGWTA